MCQNNAVLTVRALSVMSARGTRFIVLAHLHRVLLSAETGTGKTPFGFKPQCWLSALTRRQAHILATGRTGSSRACCQKDPR